MLDKRSKAKAAHPCGHGRQNLIDAFAALATEFVAWLRTEGTELSPFSGDYPHHFANLSAAARKRVFDNFRIYVEVCRAALQAGTNLADDRQMLWRMLSKKGLRPSANLFENLGDEDIFEIYSLPESVQIFRSFRFYSVCSYTLDDILCRPWFELYRRDEATTKTIYDTTMAVLSMKNPVLTEYGTGIHEQEEIDSPGMIHALIESRFFAPLFDRDHQVVAGLNVVRALSVQCRLHMGEQRPHQASLTVVQDFPLPARDKAASFASRETVLENESK